MLTVVERLAERKLIKQQWANFIATCSSSTVRDAGNKFHCNFKASLPAHPLGYKGVNIGGRTQV